MAQDTLVILCKTLNEAIIASTQLEKQHNLGRLYIFLDKKPTTSELAWLSNSDMSFCLERAIHWHEQPDLIGVRAGLMFAQGWDILFCWAQNVPSTQDINWIREQLKTEGTAKLPNVWGVTRDHYILYGLGETIPEIQSQQKKQVSSIVSGLSIAQALEGKPVDVNVAISALKEIAPLSSVAFHQTIDRINDRLIVEALAATADYVDDDTPISMVVGAKCTEDVIKELKKRIANHGAIIQIGYSDESELKPYRVINIESGVKLALYGK